MNDRSSSSSNCFHMSPAAFLACYTLRISNRFFSGQCFTLIFKLTRAAFFATAVYCKVKPPDEPKCPRNSATAVTPNSLFIFDYTLPAIDTYLWV
uniref:Uncharacterized protein n=1 Tax=Onchocerca volvulus TaxID=6282 RepID=A0A8R1U411_ONCVO